MRAHGVLRVGYLQDSLPYAFVNGRDELVGFDIEMAYIMAGDLNLALELVPVSRRILDAGLDAAVCDLVMSGVMVTTNRAAQITLSPSYLDETLAFVVPDHSRESFSSWQTIRDKGRLRIGVPALPYYAEKVRQELPEAEIVSFESTDEVFVQAKMTFDAVMLTAERGSAWTLLHPQYSVAVPKPRLVRVPLVYPIAGHDEAFGKFVAAWIELKRKDGTIDALFAHWILGRNDAAKAPRWSVARDLLHWVS